VEGGNIVERELHKIAAKACKDVYARHISLGTTEYYSSIAEYDGKAVQVLAIAGTNELTDWGINFNLTSWKGIKYGAYKAAIKLNKVFDRNKELPLLVCGHSKSGPTAVAYKRLFEEEQPIYCVAFAPARGLRPWVNRKMSNIIIFVDPDDLVDKVAFISFKQPDCEKIKLPNDHKGFYFKDHSMDNFEDFVLEGNY